MSGRFPPIPDIALDEAQRAVAAAMTSGPRGGVIGPFAVLLRAPAVADAVQRLGAGLRFSGMLDDALREIAILTVSRRWAAQFEWFAHHPIAVRLASIRRHSNGCARARIRASRTRPSNLSGGCRARCSTRGG